MEQNKFTANANDWNNHIFLLWLALEETKTGDVMEYGCGDGSTRQLHEYCKDANRTLYSFDTDPEYLKRFEDCKDSGHLFFSIINNWHIAQDICTKPTVILIDHAPGERRIVDIKNWSDNMNGIIVIHDTQRPPTSADYGYERIWHLFKYVVHLDAGKNPDPNIPDNRTWASAVSNHYDVTKWRGLTFNEGDYILK